MNTSQLNPEAAGKAAVRRLYTEALNQARYAVVDELIAPGYLVPGPDGGTGPAAFKANAERLRTGFPDVQFTIHELLVEAGRVAVYWTWEGTHRGPFAKIPPTGRRVRQEGMVIYHWEAGKVTAGRVIFDRLGVLQQLEAGESKAGN